MATMKHAFLRELGVLPRRVAALLAPRALHGGSFAREAFALLLESAPDAMLIVDAQGRMVMTNARLERLFGYSREELLGQPVEVFVPERLRQIHVQHRRAYTQAPDARPMGMIGQLHGRHKNGTEFPVEISLSPITTDQGVFVISAIRDATERDRALEELRLLHALVQAMSEAADVPSALGVAVRQLCEVTTWDYGEAWFPNADGTALICSPGWYGRVQGLEAFRAATEQAQREPGKGLIGRVWAARQAEWIQDLTAAPTMFVRTPLAVAAGLRAAFAAPVLAGNEVVAVLAFFLFEVRAKDERMAALVSAVAAQLGLVIQRKRAEEALRAAQAELEQRVIERTADLEAANESLRCEIVERCRLEQELLTISEMEQRRIGEDLHDGLGQHLLGVALKAQVVEQQLAAKSREARQVGELAQLIYEAINQTRELSRGLCPGEFGADGLCVALAHLATTMEQFSGVPCRFSCDAAGITASQAMAIQLYRIAQEALNNAIKHSRATQISISVTTAGDQLVLTVRDDGVGLPADPGLSAGLGLRIMRHRARTIGASLELRKAPDHGTVVVCSLALSAARS